MRKFVILLCLSLVVLCIWGVALLLLTPTAQASGQVIHFNGQTLDLSEAASVLIQSSNDVREFEADTQGGAVTVTTSIITVTVWMRP